MADSIYNILIYIIIIVRKQLFLRYITYNIKKEGKEEKRKRGEQTLLGISPN